MLVIGLLLHMTNYVEKVSVDCPERAKLLASIWKRYQALFQRVIQLHQEEKDYLINCHKERTTALKSELEASQAKFKANFAAI